MNEEQFFIDQAEGSFPNGAWYFELNYQNKAEITEATARKKIQMFTLAVMTYIDSPIRWRPRVLTRTRKSSRDGKVYYTHYILCTRNHEKSRYEIERGWNLYTGGAARSEILPTRYAAERRARTIAKYYLTDQKEAHQ